ncbi:MAG: hypothetical protein OXK17_05145 [Thaumarchaeota archaeon]|nr:hypothetical protein [Nitrososphaerota archaeon]
MEPSEVLLFRDYTGWEEPALSTPFGFWSLRNMIVLGIFGMVSGALYWSIVPDDLNMDDDWLLMCIALSPLAIGVLLGAANTPVGTADSVIVALLVLMARSLAAGNAGGGGRSRSGRSRKRKKSQVLGFPRRLPPPLGAVSEDDRPLEVICTDLDELKSIRITIYGSNGLHYANRIVSCYLDDELVDSVRTSPDGSLVLNLRPEREGSRRLVVREYVDASSAVAAGSGDITAAVPSGTVLLSKPLHFMRAGTAAGVGR